MIPLDIEHFLCLKMVYHAHIMVSMAISSFITMSFQKGIRGLVKKARRLPKWAFTQLETRVMRPDKNIKTKQLGTRVRYEETGEEDVRRKLKLCPPVEYYSSLASP